MTEEQEINIAFEVCEIQKLNWEEAKIAIEVCKIRGLNPNEDLQHKINGTDVGILSRWVWVLDECKTIIEVTDAIRRLEKKRSLIHRIKRFFRND